MIQYERQQAILQYLEKKSPATVKEIARAVYTSEASVRRDIATMAEKGLLTKLYGGVMLSGQKNAVIPLDLREMEHPTVKDLIAKKAAEQVFDGATVFLDASSTVWRMMKYLQGYKDLKILTNNLRIFSETEHFNGILYCTGGTYDPKNRCFVGEGALEFMDRHRVDLFFFSSMGISAEGEISDPSEEETALRKKVLSRAERSYFLCDCSKIGKQSLFTVCRKDDVEEIFCDGKLPWAE